MEFSSILFGYNYNANQILALITTPQGGMELPALYVFKTTNLEMHLQLPSLTTMQRQKQWTSQKKGKTKK